MTIGCGTAQGGACSKGRSPREPHMRPACGSLRLVRGQPYFCCADFLVF